jgi:hypothetical protein
MLENRKLLVVTSFAGTLKHHSGFGQDNADRMAKNGEDAGTVQPLKMPLLMSQYRGLYKVPLRYTGWWFQTFCFHDIWDNPSH